MNIHEIEHMEYLAGLVTEAEIGCEQQITGENEFSGDETEAQIAEHWRQYGRPQLDPLEDLIAPQLVKEVF